jgi:hypothetical protein
MSYSFQGCDFDPWIHYKTKEDIEKILPSDFPDDYDSINPKQYLINYVKTLKANSLGSCEALYSFRKLLPYHIQDQQWMETLYDEFYVAYEQFGKERENKDRDFRIFTYLWNCLTEKFLNFLEFERMHKEKTSLPFSPNPVNSENIPTIFNSIPAQLNTRPTVDSILDSVPDYCSEPTLIPEVLASTSNSNTISPCLQSLAPVTSTLRPATPIISISKKSKESNSKLTSPKCYYDTLNSRSPNGKVLCNFCGANNHKWRYCKLYSNYSRAQSNHRRPRKPPKFRHSHSISSNNPKSTVHKRYSAPIRDLANTFSPSSKFKNKLLYSDVVKSNLRRPSSVSSSVFTLKSIEIGTQTEFSRSSQVTNMQDGIQSLKLRAPLRYVLPHLTVP